MKQRKVYCKIIGVLTLAVVLATLGTMPFAVAEDSMLPPDESAGIAEPAPEESGLLELQPLLDAADVDDMEGMDLEQLTEALAEEAMSEYLNSETGFHMQYPSSFSFSEEGGIAIASGESGQIFLMIESMPKGEGLTAEMIQQAIMLDSPDAKIQHYEESGCVRFDRRQDDGSLLVDLYLITDTMIHHVSISCAETAEDMLYTYLDYMIHSISTDETDVG